MKQTRRDFLRIAGTAAAASVVGPQAAHAAHEHTPSANAMGVLVDTLKCIGCRRCEYACQNGAGFNPPPVDTFADTSVMAKPRRPHPRSYTVINRYQNPKGRDGFIYNKFNCLHCIDPSCVSACIVSAFSKREDGPVEYNPRRCMGCRYCMVACPFEIPAYEYDNALTPRVRKCNMCAHLVPGELEAPACVRICPEEVLTYGKRSELIELAHQKIREAPDVYIDHVYGEHEAGGTSWLYLASVPFDQIGFHNVPDKAPPRLTEAIQHGVFKHFMPPVMWFGLLGTAMWLSRPAPEGPTKDTLSHHEIEE